MSKSLIICSLFGLFSLHILQRKASCAPPPVDTFAPTVIYSVPNGTIGVTTADFNGDEILDIATANRWARNVSVLHGLPGGGFGNRVDTTVGTRPEYLAAGDFDGNGLSDLVVANWDDHDVTVLLQQSNGGLTTGGRYPVGDHPHMVIAEDLDGDGHTDIAAATSNNAISVLTNDKIGGFDSRQDYAIDSVGFGLLATDFNRDGILDLATTLPNTGSMINVLYGKEDGGYEDRDAFTFQANRPGLATSSDFNRDGIPDLAYAGYSHHGSMVVLLGNQEGGLELANEYPEPSFAQAMVSADFNLDGNIDLAASDYGSIWLYLGAGDGSFGDGQQINVGSTIAFLSTADLNDDGSMDIVATSGGRGWGEVYVLLNLNAVPEPTIVPFDIKPGSVPNSVNLKSKGVLPVAILSTDEFDVHNVDIDTLLFGDPLLIDNGGTAVSPLRSAYEDVSGDGLLDLTLKFSTADLVEYEALGPDTLEGLLTGTLLDGTPLEGTDSIRIVPPNGSNGNSLQVSAVPEPASVMLALAALCLAINRRRRC